MCFRIIFADGLIRRIVIACRVGEVNNLVIWCLLHRSNNGTLKRIGWRSADGWKRNGLIWIVSLHRLLVYIIWRHKPRGQRRIAIHVATHVLTIHTVLTLVVHSIQHFTTKWIHNNWKTDTNKQSHWQTDFNWMEVRKLRQRRETPNTFPTSSDQ